MLNNLEGINKTDLRDIGRESVDWIHPAQDGTSAGSCEQTNERSVFIKSSEFLD
jgi:hypothetical protein